MSEDRADIWTFDEKHLKLEEDSTHKSATTHAGFFVTHDLDVWPFDPKINGF